MSCRLPVACAFTVETKKLDIVCDRYHAALQDSIPFNRCCLRRAQQRPREVRVRPFKRIGRLHGGRLRRSLACPALAETLPRARCMEVAPTGRHPSAVAAECIVCSLATFATCTAERRNATTSVAVLRAVSPQSAVVTGVATRFGGWATASAPPSVCPLPRTQYPSSFPLRSSEDSWRHRPRCLGSRPRGLGVASRPRRRRLRTGRRDFTACAAPSSSLLAPC
jgi:hypothetical protein